MESTELLHEEFAIRGGDFRAAGQVSTRIKKLIRQLGFPPDVVRRVSIACFEAEMNVVCHAREGRAILGVGEGSIQLVFQDRGPGIPRIDLAMQEGYSTASEAIRALGFGAGMGLPNIRRNADEFEIDSEVGRGTTLRITVHSAPPTETRQ